MCLYANIVFLHQTLTLKIKMDTVKTTKEKTKKGLKARLKFVKSEKKGAYISFVYIDKDHKVRGVKENDPVAKKICILDGALNTKVIPGALYKCDIIPMANNKGYIAINIELIQFDANIVVDYKPKVAYKLTITFGNKVIEFNPFDGQYKCMRSLAKTREALEARVDIKNLSDVMEQFERQAQILVMRMKADGFVC